MIDRITKITAGAVIAAGVASGAAAQGLGDYSGPYAGLLIGYGAVDFEADDNTSAKESVTGFDFAGFVGYEVRTGRVYYSGEFEAYISTKESEDSNIVDDLEKDVGYALSARAGYFLTDGTMVYGLLGLEMADFGGTNGGENVLGARVGLGAEFRATNSISVRSEAIYTIYEDSNFGSGTEYDPSDLTVRVGGVYRFNF